MESSEHNWANISETICPKLLTFGEQASWTLFFQDSLTNPIISQISFFMTSHFGTLLDNSSRSEFIISSRAVREPRVGPSELQSRSSHLYLYISDGVRHDVIQQFDVTVHFCFQATLEKMKNCQAKKFSNATSSICFILQVCLSEPLLYLQCYYSWFELFELLFLSSTQVGGSSHCLNFKEFLDTAPLISHLLQALFCPWINFSRKVQ